jgi:hypothetical protein
MSSTTNGFPILNDQKKGNHRKFVSEMLTHYEKIMSIATSLSSCNLILSDICGCIRQVATNTIFS